jgi:hypothetical protein
MFLLERWWTPTSSTLPRTTSSWFLITEFKGPVGRPTIIFCGMTAISLRISYKSWRITCATCSVGALVPSVILLRATIRIWLRIVAVSIMTSKLIQNKREWKSGKLNFHSLFQAQQCQPRDYQSRIAAINRQISRFAIHVFCLKKLPNTVCSFLVRWINKQIFGSNIHSQELTFALLH